MSMNIYNVHTKLCVNNIPERMPPLSISVSMQAQGQ